jgi:hypothetical protein
MTVVMLQIVASLTVDSRVIIYKCIIFIIHVTDLNKIFFPPRFSSSFCPIFQYPITLSDKKSLIFEVKI